MHLWTSFKRSCRPPRPLRVELPCAGTNIGPAVRHRTLSHPYRTRMPRGRQACCAIALVGCSAASSPSCSTSSPAAIVNGQTITQPQLNQYLEAWAGSPGVRVGLRQRPPNSSTRSRSKRHSQRARTPRMFLPLRWSKVAGQGRPSTACSGRQPKSGS